MTESVKYTLESRIDDFERHLEYVEEELERTERNYVELSTERVSLIKAIEGHKRALLDLKE